MAKTKLTVTNVPQTELPEYGQWFSRDGKIYVLAATGRGPQLISPDGGYFCGDSSSKESAFGSSGVSAFKRLDSVEIKVS